MSKTLILEPFYTNFHCDLAKSFSSEVYSLVFNLGNLIYLKGSQKLLVNKIVNEHPYSLSDLNMVKNIKSLFTEKKRKLEKVEPNEAEFIYMAKYVAFLRVFLAEKQIDLVIMHNDLRWQHALAIRVCKEVGIRYLITERGLFRPHTTTFDFQGVNAFSSIPKEINFYESITTKQLPFKEQFVSHFKQFKINVKFSLFLCLNFLGEVFKVNTPLINKRYSLVSYATLFFKQIAYFKNKSLVKLPQQYIFIPLQVNTDTQVLVHSEYQDIQAFITHIEKTFYAEPSNVSLVFKPHPMDKGKKYVFDPRSIVVNCETSQLIEGSQFIITINSTVGFEAIQRYKTVIVLGEAFYKIPKLCIVSTFQSFREDLSSCLNHKAIINPQLVDKFVFYLKNEYQVNGNLFNYDVAMFKDIKQRVDKQKKP